MSTKPKILLYDIETTYSEGAFWGGRKYDQTILRVTKERELLSIAWEWLGSGVVEFDSREGEKTDKRLTKTLRDLLEEADLVVAHNGDKFDITVSRTRMLHHRLKPLKQQVSVDTCKAAKRYFNFTGNSLEDLAQFLGVGSKLPHQGLSLWTGCIENDRDCWETMIRYNKHDVTLLREVYNLLRPWIENHPNIAKILNPRNTPINQCTNCAGINTQSRGTRGGLRRHYCWDCDKHYSTRLGKERV